MYNNCFLLTGTAIDTKSGKRIKKAMYIDKRRKVRTLYKWDLKNNRVIEENLKYYQMSYDAVKATLDDYRKNGTATPGDESLRIGIWLEDAMWNDLKLLCIDFDKIDGQIVETPFFLACLELADFYTRSQSGGYHCWFGINREVAEPLFEQINLTTHRNTKSFVCAINLTSDGNDKFDIFCCNGRLIHEYEEWQPERGVSDKTQALYDLLQGSIQINRKKEIDYWEDAEGKHIVLEGLDESYMLEQMSDGQSKVFQWLKENDSNKTRAQWFSIGCNIKEVFNEEFGGSVWLWWSRGGVSYQEQSCVNTWGEICRRKTVLMDNQWAEWIGQPAFSEHPEQVHEEYILVDDERKQQNEMIRRKNAEQMRGLPWFKKSYDRIHP